jgi:hypothetical protein
MAVLMLNGRKSNHMLESLSGHNRWLNSPDDPEHHEECPAHPDNRGDDGVCLCEELADAAFDEAMERHADARREG